MTDTPPPDDGWLEAPVEDLDAPPEKGRGRRKKRGPLRLVQGEETHDAGGRPFVALVPYRETECIGAVVEALAARCTELYQRAGMLVRVTREAPPAGDGPVSASAPRIGTLPRPILRSLIDGAVRIQEQKGAELRNAHPPDWLVAQIDALGEWQGVRRLEMVTQCPVMRPDGTVVTEPGYDPETGLLYEPNFEPLPLPEVPRRDDALAALEELRDVVCDFPFVAPQHEAGWLALLLTPFARFAFKGPTPLGVIDGSVAGVGKGKLAQVISLLVDGVDLSPTPQPEEVEEERKLITSIALTGRRLVLIDNVTRQVGSGPMEALLTATRWSDRLLGASKTFDGDVLTQWLVTGNNVSFRKKDTIRRCVHVRVEAKTDSPESRSNWVHDPLLSWVLAERPRLVRAALTILRAHALEGYPNPCRAQWGSFEGWSDKVRAALVWLGCADPADTRRELSESSDTEGTALIVVLEHLHRCQVLGADGLTARALLERAGEHEDLSDALEELSPSRRGSITSRALGYAMRTVKGRVMLVDGRPLALGSVSGPNHSTLWCAVDP